MYDEQPDGDPHGECAAEIHRLLQRLRDAEEDAKRYRWLRDVGDATWRPFGLREGYSAAQADAVIDAAIAKETK